MDEDELMQQVMSRLANVSTELDAAARKHVELLANTRKWDEYLEHIATGIAEMSHEVKRQTDERHKLLTEGREERMAFLEYLRNKRTVPVSVVLMIVSALSVLLIFQSLLMGPGREVDFVLPGIKGSVKPHAQIPR